MARTGLPRTAVLRGGFRVHARDRATTTAPAVVVATPAHVTSTLAADLDAELAALCGGIRYVAVVNVALSYSRDAVRDPLHEHRLPQSSMSARQARRCFAGMRMT